MPTPVAGDPAAGASDASDPSEHHVPSTAIGAPPGRRLGTSQRAHVRELMASALVGIQARRRVDPDHEGRITVTSATGGGPLVVRDDGIGFTAQEMRWIDARGDAERYGPVRSGLRRYETALVAAFQVADVVELVSRSALVPLAPTMRWVGLADGTVRVGLAEEPLEEAGTEIRLHPRAATRPWCTPETTRQAVVELADQMPVAVEVDGAEVSGAATVWSSSPEEQQAWFRERHGVDPLVVLPLAAAVPGVRALAAVLPHGTHPGEHPAHHKVVCGMPSPDDPGDIVPEWAGFCLVLVDDSRDVLTDPRYDDAAVAEQLSRSLLLQLILLGATRPGLFTRLMDLHGEALARRASGNRDLLDLVRSTVPLPTSLGPRTIDMLADLTGVVPFTDDPVVWSKCREAAARDGVLVVDARQPHVARLLDALDAEGLSSPRVSRLRHSDLVALGVAS